MNVAEHQWQNLREALKWRGSERALEVGLLALATPTYYPRLCAWCEAEGMRTIVGYTTIEHSSGICAEHLAQLNAESSKLKAEQKHPVNPVDFVEDLHEAEQATAL